MAMPAVQVSPVATKAAALISHDLQEIAEKAEGPIIASAGGTIERWAARRVYPYAVEKIPVVTEVGCDHLMSKFGEMPMSKVAAWLVEHATAKGQTPHWSVRAAAEAR
jgi:hypothetical protein